MHEKRDLSPEMCLRLGRLFGTTPQFWMNMQSKVDIWDSLALHEDEVMAIGDNNNDLPMLEYAGTAVAMGNAIEKIKEQADFVTRSNDQDGVAHALRQLLG